MLIEGGSLEAPAAPLHELLAKGLAAAPDDVALVSELPLGTISFGSSEAGGKEGDRAPRFEALLEGDPPADDLAPPEPSSPAAIFFTSGSTGPAKGRDRVGYKAPEEVVVLDEMPLNPTGKIDRVGLKRLAEDHLHPHGLE